MGGPIAGTMQGPGDSGAQPGWSWASPAGGCMAVIYVYNLF